MAVGNYDPAQIVLTVAGVPLTGYADGKFVTCERMEDMYSMKKGADGFVSRAKSNDRSGSVTITLQHTSPSNDYMQGLADLDEATGLGAFPVLIKDLLGSTMSFAASAWIRKLPAAERSKEVGETEWVIDCAQLTIKNGGSPVT